MISVYMLGRLGNQLFQYVMMRTAAKLNNCNFFIPNSEESAKIFYTRCNQLFHKNMELPVPSNPHYWIGNDLFDADMGNYDDILTHSLDEPKLDNIINGSFLIGFFQSEEYIINNRDEVKEWLKIKKDIITESLSILDKYNTNEYCYIHFRGGDYKSLSQWYLPHSYYNDAINKIKTINTNIKFLIITDDKEEASKIFPDIDVINNKMEIDFYLLSKSKYTIIPNSSFSWWASWLNDDNIVTIAPNGWFNYNINGSFEPKNIKSSRFTYIDKL